DSTNEKVVISYQDDGNSDYGTSIVGTVSGTSISFGTKVVFKSASIGRITSVFDSANNKVVVSYGEGVNGYSRVGTVSGTSISFGTEVLISTMTSSRITSTFDSNSDKVVICYREGSTGKSRVGTVSGTNISFGTEATFESAEVDWISAGFDTVNNKVIIGYSDVGNSSFGTSVIGTVSGTNISFGTPVVFESASSHNISVVYMPISGKVHISYIDAGNSSYGTSNIGTVSGTSISFVGPVVFESAGSNNVSSVFDTLTNTVVIAYRATSNYGTSIVYEPTYIDTNVNITIGIATEAISDTATGLITIIAGVNDQQSGLTIGTLYYVQYDGAITSSPDTNYDYKTLGRAISVTEILIEKIE
ncbi:hypothetical protein LCGC14_2515560, partial [marine sediment metagenome]